MKRIAVVIGIVVGIAATPTVVAAGDSNGQSKRDPYEHARDWNTQQGQLYGPIEVAPSYLRFLREVGARHVPVKGRDRGGAFSGPLRLSSSVWAT